MAMTSGTSKTSKTVGFIGLGIMGGGMVGRLLDQGFAVTVWNRTATKADPLVARGARLAASPAEATATADVVVLIIRDDASVREVLLGSGGALAAARPGTTFINMTTTTPGLGQAMEAAAAARGCAFLDAPVAGSRVAAATGKLVISVSGKAEVLEAQRDVLSAMGETIMHLGPVGTSAAFKLANNQFAAALIAVLGEGLALAEASGIAREQMIEALAATATRVCGLKKVKIATREWSPDFTLELMAKDLDQAVDTATKAGLAVPLMRAVRDRYHEARRKGGGNAERDFAVVTELGSAAVAGGSADVASPGRQ